MSNLGTNNPSNNDVVDQKALLVFIDDLIKAKNDPSITEKELPEVRKLLLNEVNLAINSHLVNLLPKKAQLELDKLLDENPSDEQLNVFFIRNVSNLEIEVAAALLNFRAAYLYSVRDQIVKAVESISPVVPNVQTSVDEKILSAPLSPAPVQPSAAPNQNFDFPLPSAPPAPLPSTGNPNDVKKWN